MKTPGQRLKFLREAAGFNSGRSAALAFGWKESTYRAHETDKRTIGMDDAKRYAHRFRPAAPQASPQFILFGTEGGEHFDTEAAALPNLPLSGDLPIYGTAEAGEGAIIIAQDVIDTMPRPAWLVGVPDAYALYVVGDSMAPVYRAGDIIAIHPHSPPRRDEGAVFYSTEPGRAQLKEFVSQTPSEWRVRRYHPKEQEFTLSRREWPRCHFVYARFSRR